MKKNKEELYHKLQGQLSSDKIELDVDNAYSVVEEKSILFSLFCAENCYYQGDGWWNRSWKDEALKTIELFKIWENGLD